MARIILDYQPIGGYSAAGISARDAADVIVSMLEALKRQEEDDVKLWAWACWNGQQIAVQVSKREVLAAYEEQQAVARR